MTILMGYADRVSLAPGEGVAFKVSCAGAATYRAEIRRVLSPEAGPTAPPFRTERVETPVSREYDAREQPLRCGSWAMVPPHPLIAALESFSIQAFIWPTLPGRGRQAILGTWSEVLGTGFGLQLGESGEVELRLGSGNGAVAILASGVPVEARHWYFVAASYDRSSGIARLHQELVAAKRMTIAAAVEKEAPMPAGFLAQPKAFFFAAWHAGDDDGTEFAGRPLTGGHFNGKIDRPRLADRALTRAEIAALCGASVPSGLEAVLLASWDFARDMTGDAIRDASPNRLDGTTQNLPTRAMTGHNWDGAEMNWRHAPEQYGAIHFHDDDLADAGWATDFTFIVPEGLKSGCYAAFLTAAEARFQIPFFIRPPRGTASADIVYLASTATYTVYCNNIGRFGSTTAEVYHGRVTVMDDVDIMLLKHPEMGLSTYDRHSDGSGVFYSSRLRPASNIR
ncbi:MAG: LamG domain-containing protein, partial [Alphaproteobacteria bacterium]|nr:LamG domain-containing protein [Alphaproteobacteria bacterium]